MPRTGRPRSHPQAGLFPPAGLSLKVEGLHIVPKPPKPNADPDEEKFNVCTAQTVTIDPGDYLLEWQAFAHHGPDWRIYFPALRNGVERDNSQVKSGAGQALAVADRRYLRSRANNGLMAAWMLMGHNVELLRSWLRKAKQDKDGVIVQAPLKNRRGDRRPEHARAAWEASRGSNGAVKGGARARRCGRGRRPGPARHLVAPLQVASRRRPLIRRALDQGLSRLRTPLTALDSFAPASERPKGP